MKNMDIAVDRVIANIKSKTPIFIFGDYDVDGTTGASLLSIGLISLGATVDTYIPNRVKEGYGVSELGIDKAKKFGADLFITCDCGTRVLKSAGADIFGTWREGSVYHRHTTVLTRAY